MILAAGKGERLEPLTLSRPKHLLPVAGSPLIVHTLKAVKSVGIDEALIVVHYMKEAISSYLGDGSSLSVKLQYADQGGIFGTGHALKMAQDFVGGEPFLLVYGDLAFHPDVLKRAVSAYSKKLSGVLVGVDLEDVHDYGAMELDGDLLRRFIEKPKSGGAGTINGGIYLFSPQIFKFVDATPKSQRGELELTTTINLSIEQGGSFRVLHVSSDEWVDVGRPWNVLEANKMLMDACLKESTILGKVEEGVRLHGKVYVGDGASVLSGSYVEGPVWISSGCKVGPNCYLRPYTFLCRGARVGNACEVKASIIMDGSHIGHISYIGDSVIGAKCNLGAGTITANLRFDDMPVKVAVKDKRSSSGKKKLGMFMGDGVKTGINVSVYPGVKIGPGSWIKPHVVLNKDVLPGMIVSSKIELEMMPRR